MVGIGPFIAHKKTPLGNNPGGTVDQTLVMLALTRLLLPSVYYHQQQHLVLWTTKDVKKHLKQVGML